MVRQKLAALVCFSAVMVLATACGREDDSAAWQVREPFTDAEGFTHAIRFAEEGEVNVFAHSEGRNYQKVIDKFERVTEGTLKTSLNFEFALDIKQEVNMKLAAKEDIDLIFDASWVNMDQNIKAGMYADLTSYFGNDNFPGLKKVFTPELIQAMKAPDGKIYGIPYFWNYKALDCVYIRGDWRERYNVPKVTDQETLRQYLDAVQSHAEELGIASAIGLMQRGYYQMNQNWSVRNEQGIFSISGTSAVALLDMTDGEGSPARLVDVGMLGDLEHDYSAWPDAVNPFNEDMLEIAAEWGQYVNDDTLTAQNVREKFARGMYGATEGGFEHYVELMRQLAAYDPNAKLEYYLYDEGIRNREKIYRNAVLSQNYMFVPYYCDDIDRVMAVVDRIFESQKNNDLWSLGIEGEDWIDVGEGKYELTADNAHPYSFPTWLWSEAPVYHRVNASLPDDVVSYIRWSQDTANFKVNPFSGFSFDKAPIADEYVALKTLWADYESQFATGAFGGAAQDKLAEYSTKAQPYQNILRDEAARQVEACLRNNDNE